MLVVSYCSPVAIAIPCSVVTFDQGRVNSRKQVCVWGGAYGVGCIYAVNERGEGTACEQVVRRNRKILAMYNVTFTFNDVNVYHGCERER